MMTIVSTILADLPLLIWSVIFLWSPVKTEGEELLRVDISLLGRFKMLVLPLVVGAVVLLVTAIWLEFRWWMLALWILVYGAVLLIPQSYLLTSTGIRLGRGPFRRWTEFSGVRRSSSGATLQGGPKSASYPVFLGGNREDDDFVLLLRTLVRDSYKGKTIDRAEIVPR